MFDKLIESNSVEADFKPRGRYFTVSSVIVGILFLTAVVVSLYAQDLDLGTDNFDVAELQQGQRQRALGRLGQRDRCPGAIR